MRGFPREAHPHGRRPHMNQYRSESFRLTHHSSSSSREALIKSWSLRCKEAERRGGGGQPPGKDPRRGRTRVRGGTQTDLTANVCARRAAQRGRRAPLSWQMCCKHGWMCGWQTQENKCVGVLTRSSTSRDDNKFIVVAYGWLFTNPPCSEWRVKSGWYSSWLVFIYSAADRVIKAKKETYILENCQSHSWTVQNNVSTVTPTLKPNSFQVELWSRLSCSSVCQKYWAESVLFIKMLSRMLLHTTPFDWVVKHQDNVTRRSENLHPLHKMVHRMCERFSKVFCRKRTRM